MFTEEELEKLVWEYRIDEVNQNIIKQIHMIFGGYYHKKDDYEYNYVMFRLNDGVMYIVYNSTTETFIFSEPGFETKIINYWKLKKVIEKITKAFKKDKEKKLEIKIKKIKEDFD